MQALSNLCLDIVVEVPQLPPADEPSRRALLQQLTAQPPPQDQWEVGAGSSRCWLLQARASMYVCLHARFTSALTAQESNAIIPVHAFHAGGRQHQLPGGGIAAGPQDGVCGPPGACMDTAAARNRAMACTLSLAEGSASGRHEHLVLAEASTARSARCVLQGQDIYGRFMQEVLKVSLPCCCRHCSSAAVDVRCSLALAAPCTTGA